MNRNTRPLMLAVLQKAVREAMPQEMQELEAVAGRVRAAVIAPLLDLYLSARIERDEAEAACAGLLERFDKAAETVPPWGGDPGHALLRARAVVALAAEREKPKPKPEEQT